MDSIKYYLAISAACAFTLTPCSAKEAIGEALLQGPPHLASDTRPATQVPAGAPPAPQASPAAAQPAR